MFERQEPGDTAVLNALDPECQKLRGTVPRGVRIVTIAAAPRAVADALPTPGGFSAEGASYQLQNPALRGAHNLANAMAAALLARALGAIPAAIQAALDHFPGLPHRLERIRVWHGAEWLNDSKRHQRHQVHAGGAAGHRRAAAVDRQASRRKATPCAPGAPAPAPAPRSAFDEDAGRIAAELPAELAPRAEALWDGWRRRRWCAAGRCVARYDCNLLSPACASSYDQFKNATRALGEVFRRLNEALPAEAQHRRIAEQVIHAGEDVAVVR